MYIYTYIYIRERERERERCIPNSLAKHPRSMNMYAHIQHSHTRHPPQLRMSQPAQSMF